MLKCLPFPEGFRVRPDGAGQQPRTAAGTEKLGVATDFTFYLVDTGQWEGRDHHVRLAQPGA
jgi:hypothetical protein